MTTQTIVSCYDSNNVLFECEVPDGLGSGLAMRYALETAVAANRYLSGANLSGANLSDVNLSGANLSGANLSGANLRDANLSDVNLSDVNLSGAYLSDAYLSGANLSGANLRGANLRGFKTDFFDVLLRAPHEIAGLRAALVAGRVDGSTYSGECACLVGTIANVRHANYDSLGNGLSPDSSRPIEGWFMNISKGDTPETNQCSALAIEWLDDFVSLLALATTTSEVA